jgi:AraC-like DNA-binding protein
VSWESELQGLKQHSPGDCYTFLPRPPGIDALPFRVRFDGVDAISRSRHLVKPHIHDHYEVIMPESGTYDFTINQVNGRVKRNGLIVLKPGDVHEDLCRGEIKFLNMHFRLLPGPTPQRSFNLFADGAKESEQIVRVSDGACNRLARRAWGIAQRTDPFAGHVLDGLTMEFVWELARLLSPKALAPKLVSGIDRYGFANQVHAYFERNIFRILRTPKMAAELGLSERTLSARCRAVLGDSPKRLFVRRQMDYAHTLMIQTDMSIKDISEHLGFENQYHFSTVYKRVHGVSPSMARLPK